MTDLSKYISLQKLYEQASGKRESLNVSALHYLPKHTEHNSCLTHAHAHTHSLISSLKALIEEL